MEISKEELNKIKNIIFEEEILKEEKDKIIYQINEQIDEILSDFERENVPIDE